MSMLASGEKLVVVTAKGPATNTTIGAGSDATIDLSVQPGSHGLVISIVAIREITGLPSGVVLTGVAVISPTTIRLYVRNVGTANATATANSVTATALALAL